MRGALAYLALAAPILFGCAESPQSGPHGEIRAPANSLTLDGQRFDLWQGREAANGTVLVFTRSDCPISNRYAPTLNSLCQSYRDRGIVFYLVYVDPRENPDSIQRHRQEFYYQCPGLHDPLHELVELCDATVTPEAAIFDSERKLIYRGRIDDLYADFGQSRATATTHELADALDALLAGKPVAQPRTKAVGCYIGDLE